MGNQGSKKRSNHEVKTNIMKCPKCKHVFPSQIDFHEFATHIRNCLEDDDQRPQQKNVYKSMEEQKHFDFHYEKVPIDNTYTKFKWEKKPTKPLNSQIKNMADTDVKKLSFQEKQYWFRHKIEQKRISWQHGADYMKLQKQNILMSSLIESAKVNMYKEVKIQFHGDKVNDAGGLLRQWAHMVIKQIFDESTGIFSVANTEDITYKLKWDSDLDEEFSGQLFYLFGVILGKSIFQRIPLLCYLDRTILRQLCEGAVKIEDVYGYDHQLYKNWNFILQQENIEDELETYFVMNKETGHTVEQIELVEDGASILVTDKNKFMYVDTCIQVMTMEMVQRSMSKIKEGLGKVIPNHYLSIFEPYELEMILYGVPFIDVKDWKQHTTYKSPYTQNHQVIKWFWTVMEKLDQGELSNVLHFCTASSRTPIHGFKKLESNRGNFSKFLIEGSNFTKENPYPKGHTCFNRLELPMYPKFELLETYVMAIAKNSLDGIFGLD